MEYGDIFILGWNVNAMMFVVNLLVAINIFRSEQVENIEKNRQILDELHTEFDKLYPNRKFETLISYLIPFTAFYKVGYKLIEIYMFLQKNQNSTIFDFMIYKYQVDIQRAKNR